jgi:uncharacterized membrane protein YidH (DUF202 family)
LDDNTRLALIRTLLAAERNYLAIERTQLSQLRTGLSLAVIAPSAAATFSFAFTYLPESLQFELVFYIILTGLTIFGVYTTFASLQKLRKTRAVRKIIRIKETEVMSETEFVRNYFEEILKPENK